MIADNSQIAISFRDECQENWVWTISAHVASYFQQQGPGHLKTLLRSACLRQEGNGTVMGAEPNVF